MAKKARPMDEARFRECIAYVNETWIKHRDAFEHRAALVYSDDHQPRQVRMLISASRGESRDLFVQSPREAWGELGYLAVHYMEHGGAPAELREWAAEVLADTLRRRGDPPKRPIPRRDSRERGRDRLICTAIYDVVKRYGLPATRNGPRLGPKCSAHGGSAVDVVGAAWFGLFSEKGYSNTARIWGKRDTRLFHIHNIDAKL